MNKQRFVTGKRPNPKNPRFTVYMTEELKSALIALAHDKGMSMNETICEAVEYYLDAQEV